MDIQKRSEELFYETYVPFEFLERFIKFVFYIKLVFSVKDIP